MHTGQLEGINNRIEVMERMAYGYRDSDSDSDSDSEFVFKTRAAFHGNP
jgi:transposase